MARTTSGLQISERGGPPRQVLVQASLRHSPDRHETAVSQKHLAAPRRRRPLSLLPTNRLARTTVEAQEDHKKAAIIKPQEYPNAIEDQDHFTPDLTIHAQEDQRKVITAFGDEIYDLFSSGISTVEELWTDCISTLCPQSLKTWPKGPTYKWCQLSRSRGIHLDSG